MSFVVVVVDLRRKGIRQGQVVNGTWGDGADREREQVGNSEVWILWTETVVVCGGEEEEGEGSREGACKMNRDLGAGARQDPWWEGGPRHLNRHEYG